MIETHLNLFDAAVLAIMALSCMLAFFRGFVREILSLGAWVGAGVITLYLFPTVAEQLKPHFKSAVVAAGFATLGIYIAALLLFSMFNMLILKFLKSGSDVGFIDNWLGLFFGAFRGAFILSLGFFLMTMVLTDEEKYPDWLKTAVTRPYVQKGAQILVHVAPGYLQEISSLSAKIKTKSTIQDDPYTNRGAETLNKDDSKQLNAMDRLLEGLRKEKK